MKKITLGLLSIFTASSLFAGTYSVDTSHSTAGFSVKHMMVSNVVGKIKDISGTYEYDEKANTLLSVQGELNVASIDTADEKRDAHLKADDILDVAKFPKILESLRKSIESFNFNTVGHKTCSIGGTIYLENEDILKTIKRADDAVYKAKELGRNKVVIF